MIRETHDDDAPGVVDLMNEVYPSWVLTEKGWLHWRATQPERARRLSLVAVESDRIVGVATGRMDIEAEREGAARISVVVRPGSRGRGIGGELYELAAAHVGSHGAQRLLTSTRADAGSRKFAESRGFRHTLTERVSGVDPRTVDLSDFPALEAQKAGEGYGLVPMTDVAADEIYHVDVESTRDMPMDEQIGDIPYDEWEARYWQHPNLTLEGSRVVVADGKAVSFAMLHADVDRGKATNEMTGTLRDFRGRRLARLAKLGTIAWAVENGITQILTGNDETNAPMLAINVSLGYRPIDAELSWVKEL